MAVDQDIDQLEHRLRVQELLHFARANQIAAFTTKHGLAQHVQKFHQAEEAVQNNRSEDLLDDPNVLELVSSQLLYERELCPGVSDMPTDVAIQPAEHALQLMWFGFGRYLYKMPSVKLALTIHCQICNATCRSGDEMMLHLYANHLDLVTASDSLLHLFRWAYFQSLGCLCNPTRGYGVPNHVCPALTQLAILCYQTDWQLTLPWMYRTSELLSFFGDLLDLADLKRITLNLLTRQFHKLWCDPALVSMLKRHCVYCGEAVPFELIRAHLQRAHQFGFNTLTPVIRQVCKVLEVEHSDGEYCDHCGSLLPIMDDEACTPDPASHLGMCTMTLQFSVFLAHPIPHRDPYDPNSWPSREVIANTHQHMDLQREMFNVFAEQLTRNRATTAAEPTVRALPMPLLDKQNTGNLREVFQTAGHDAIMNAASEPNASGEMNADDTEHSSSNHAALTHSDIDTTQAPKRLRTMVVDGMEGDEQ